MTKMTVKGLGFVAAAVLSAALALQAAALEPQEIADDLLARNNAMVDELAALNDAGELSQQGALELIQKHASPKLDFAKLTQRAMGKNWRKADDDAKAKLQAAFQALLENTYAKLLTGYRGQKIQLAEVKPRDKGASVVLEILGGAGAKIEYVCREVGGDYAVGDIKVEGISLVANYRRQFAAVIKAGGIDGLVAKLEELAAERAPE